MEATIATPGVGGAKPTGAIDPIYDYRRGFAPFQGFAVTGGYVYRGPVAELQGTYFFADFASDQIWSLRFDNSDPTSFDGTNFTDLTNWTGMIPTDFGNINDIASFGEDNLGNLYIVDLGGEIFQLIVPAPTTALLLLPLLLAMRRRPRTTPR